MPFFKNPEGDSPENVARGKQIAKAMRAGADDFLMKPFDRDIVEAKLQEVGAL